MGINRCFNIMDFRRIAKRKLPAPVFHYLDGGADDEWSLRRNTDAYNDYELLPSHLSDVSSIDTRSTLFGQPVDLPLMIAPTGANRLFHRDGEPAVAKAADDSGIRLSARRQLMRLRQLARTPRCSRFMFSRIVS
jgi:L-lactate dehydrogenase (cytochrome)